MDEKETKVAGPVAGNTTITLFPKQSFKEVVENLDLDNYVEADHIHASFEDLLPEPAPVPFASEQGSLRQRVSDLEDRMDSLLDRIALYNIRSQHRI